MLQAANLTGCETNPDTVLDNCGARHYFKRDNFANHIEKKNLIESDITNHGNFNDFMRIYRHSSLRL